MNVSSSPSHYLTEHEAAAFLGLQRGTLSNWRSQRCGPPYVRLGGSRFIRYKLADLESFATRDRIDPEADGRGATR